MRIQRRRPDDRRRPLRSRPESCGGRMRRIAIVGAGVSGLTVAWQLLRDDPFAEVTLFEASGRVGGIVETVRRDGFVIELGPDSWVTEKPAAQALATELGLADELITSNDDARKTLLLLNGRLEPIPDRMRMMVPMGREALCEIEASPLLSPEAKLAYYREVERAVELRRAVPTDDESIASFTERHFGREVLRKLAAPLLSGVFGGDVRRLSVHAVMGPFVAMEREHGSLIAGLGEREAERRAAGRTVRPIFTSLRSGLGTLCDALRAQLPAEVLRLRTRVQRIERVRGGWQVRVVEGTRGDDPSAPEEQTRTSPTVRQERFDDVILATPAAVSVRLLGQVDRAAATLLTGHASSAILVAFAWRGEEIALPAGFGFLVPPAERGRGARASRLLAGTFVDQKFGGRAPEGGRLVRAFFGTEIAERLLRSRLSDEGIAKFALSDLERILGPLPLPEISLVRRWPQSLPQYSVGHLERVARFERRLAGQPGLHLLGNGLHGVGLPDLIRRARELAHAMTGQRAG